MSKILELDDFEAYSIINNIEIEYFAMFFFYIIEWAYSRKFLSEDLENNESFINAIKKVRNQEIDGYEFVSKQIDYKLCTGFFKDEIISENIESYITVDYDKHISEYICGGKTIKVIKNIYKDSTKLFEAIDADFKVFLEINYPEQVNDYFPIENKR